MTRMVLIGLKGETNNEAIWIPIDELGVLGELLAPLLKGGKEVVLGARAKSMTDEQRGQLRDDYDGWE